MSGLYAAFPLLRRLRPLRPYLEPVVAVVLVMMGAVGGATGGVAAIFFIVTLGVAVALARFQPIASIAVVAAVSVVDPAFSWYFGAIRTDVSGEWLLLLGAVAIGLIAMSTRTRVRWWDLAIAVLAGVALGWLAGAIALGVILFIGAWGVGTAIAEALSRLSAVQQTEVLTEQLDASQLQLAVTAERERVAQEVHDVVAHSLAVILAQAEGARALSTKRPAAMTDALDRIAAQSRSALLDVRGIVDGLTGGAEPPQPTVDDLPELLRGVEEAGVVVRSTSAGEARELGLAQQTAVYRIVQEGATNAIRHRGRGSALDVVLDWRGPGLSIQVVSSGTGDAVPAPGAGRGIPGMTDRARIAGGWLAAGEDESGAHRITAFVPFREEPAVTDIRVPA